MADQLPLNFRETANSRYAEARKFWSKWYAEARAAYDFIAGDQWLHDDLEILKVQNRPSITFNYSEKMIDAVVGAEVSGRQEVTYAPRELSDSPLTEMFTNAAKWVADESNFEDEETEAFRDALICGLGWTHMRVSFDTDPDGMIVKDRIDPLMMLADPAAIKMGLQDRRFSFCNVWIDEKDFKRQWPEALIIEGDDSSTGNQGVQVVRTGQHYNEGEPEVDQDLHKDQVQIRHYECVELLPYYRVFPKGQPPQDMTATEFAQVVKTLKENGVQYVKMYKRTYYYAWFNGETMLEAGLSPTQEGFTYGCITGKRDRNNHTWYGLTRVMMDPQRWANKWLSQILHIINSNAKGGLLAEVNAFVDPKKAQDEWASPESVTLLNEGGLTKVKEKQVVNYPTGLDRLMEFALSSLPQVTGINLEALGLAGREQANVLEQSRKQAAYGLLAPVFNSLRNYRKQQGRVLFDLINTYISDGRMIRIGGPESKQFIPLRHVDDAITYDIIIDQSPNAPDVKRQTWEVLETLVPAAMKVGMPIPPTILKYAPIPTSLATEWQQYISQGMASPQKMQQLQEENQQLKQQVQDKSQELQLKAKAQQDEHAMKMQQMQQEFFLRMKELQQEMMMEMQKLRQELQIREVESAAKIESQKKIADAQAEAIETKSHQQPSSGAE
ncbi:MAG TPA: hypothetical protein VF443_01815 [Nitrospira sp.]